MKEIAFNVQTEYLYKLFYTQLTVWKEGLFTISNAGLGAYVLDPASVFATDIHLSGDVMDLPPSIETFDFCFDVAKITALLGKSKEKQTNVFITETHIRFEYGKSKAEFALVADVPIQQRFDWKTLVLPSSCSLGVKYFASCVDVWKNIHDSAEFKAKDDSLFVEITADGKLSSIVEELGIAESKEDVSTRIPLTCLNVLKGFAKFSDNMIVHVGESKPIVFEGGDNCCSIAHVVAPRVKND